MLHLRMFHFALLSILYKFAVAANRGSITLVNATPYDWHLTYSHHYQMKWNPLQIVQAGESREILYQYSKNKDDGAEARYIIQGHPSNASFVVQARHGGRRRIEVQFENDLVALNNPKGSLLNLGWEQDGTVLFVLSGVGADIPFISTNPPVAWMQALMPSIGEKSLREICLLASHDSGASEITIQYSGTKHNVLTQSGDVYQQLLSGVRFLDIRPVLRKNKWYTAHLTIASRDVAFGALTRTLKDVILDINQFTSEYPGELIILDISHGRVRQGWRRFRPTEWQDLYRELKNIRDLWPTPVTQNNDITTCLVSTFIQPGSRSAILFRVPNYAPLPDDRKSIAVKGSQEYKIAAGQETKSNHDLDKPSFNVSETSKIMPKGFPEDVPHPLGAELSSSSTRASVPPQSALSANHDSLNDSLTLPIFTHSYFPINGGWSDTFRPTSLISDQLSKLSQFRRQPTDVMLRSVWTLTQKWQEAINVGIPKKSILRSSVHARKAMYAELWPQLSDQTYPNLLELDDVWGRGMVAFAMAINDRFALDRTAPRNTFWKKRESSEKALAENRV